jgi:ribosome recycling factor
VNVLELELDLRKKSKATIDHFIVELGKMRSGRATTGLLESVMVEYYGVPTPLIQLGLLAAPEPRLLTIQVYDQNAIESVEKAIHQSGLGLNPSRDGSTVRVVIPSLTEERRKELVKKLLKLAEETKIAVRNLRRTSIDSVKKRKSDKELAEDEARKLEAEIQKVTDQFVAEIDKHMSAKEKELMDV